MNDPADFLSRWSRRKRAATEGRVEADDADRPETESPEARATTVKADARPESSDAEPAFDISKLPSLESIGPDTDVSAFLQPGVPATLRHAALRRVWVSDPAIRDFRAPQEMDWDFNSPGLPGFGEIGPDIDVKKMAARILGGSSPDEVPEDVVHASPAPSAPESERLDANHASPTDEHGPAAAVPDKRGTPAVHREENIASQQDETMSPAKARRHGRALPE